MLLSHASLVVFLALPLTSLAAPAGGHSEGWGRSTRGGRGLTKRTNYLQDGSQVSGKSYDYVIAGGGLTGVVLAKRLAEDAGKTILLIEAGNDEETNPDVYGESPALQKEEGGGIRILCAELH
jgi:hypothetical protein